MPSFYCFFLRAGGRLALAALLALSAAFSGVRAQGLVADTTELRVLRELYQATDGPQWTTRTNWLSGTTLAEAATWYGVTVAGGDVTQLVLTNNGLRGPLPASLGRLARLQLLQLG
ncbi:MAG TPA: hypothetical protein VF690_13550, partial [Hymenobacter sp.]